MKGAKRVAMLPKGEVFSTLEAANYMGVSRSYAWQILKNHAREKKVKLRKKRRRYNNKSWVTFHWERTR